jgi:D-glycero-alpha-D-manno-heptose-7-phosphate kinase
LREQENSTRSHSSSTVEALHEVKALGEKMRVALESGHLQTFGELLHEGWQAKRRVSNKISTPRIDQLYRLARENGALGGKITGAGGGGFLLLYCEKSSQHAVRGALSSEGVHEMAFTFDMSGAQVIVDDPFIDSDERAGARWVFVPTSAALAVTPRS